MAEAGHDEANRKLEATVAKVSQMEQEAARSGPKQLLQQSNPLFNPDVEDDESDQGYATVLTTALADANEALAKKSQELEEATEDRREARKVRSSSQSAVAA